MDNAIKQKLTQNLNAAEKSRNVIENGIQTLEKKLADLRTKSNQQLFATGESDLVKEVISLNGDLEIRYDALQKANTEVEAAKFALSDFENAERYTEGIKLGNDMLEIVGQIEKQLTDTGLNGLINQANDLVTQMFTIISNQDQSNLVLEVRRAHNVLVNLNHALYTSWVDLRIAAPSVSTPVSGAEDTHYRPGFGRYY